jgi:spermidine synthase
MKPRIILKETKLPDGSTIGLHEHDGRRYLVHGTAQVAGPLTRVSERELGRTGCAPFRPVKQPKVWIAGLALGEVLAGAMEILLQKRATFYVAEPWPDIAAWHREFLSESPLAAADSRIELLDDVTATGLHPFDGTLHAVLLHADTAPPAQGKRPLHEDPRWLAAAHGALQPGGLLAIASSRPVPEIERKLGRAGFEIARHEIDAAPNARRPRRHFLWLARKGKSGD